MLYHIYCPICEVYLREKNSLPEDVHCSYYAGNVDMSKPSNFFHITRVTVEKIIE